MEVRHDISLTGGCAAPWGCGHTLLPLSCIVYKALFGLILQLVQGEYKVMPIRSCCEYLELWDHLQTKDALKMVQNLGRASLQAYLQSQDRHSGVGQGSVCTNAKLHFK